MATTFAGRIQIRNRYRVYWERRVHPDDMGKPEASQREQKRKIRELTYYFELTSAETVSTTFDAWMDNDTQTDPKCKVHDQASGASSVVTFLGTWYVDDITTTGISPGKSRVDVSLHQYGSWTTV